MYIQKTGKSLNLLPGSGFVLGICWLCAGQDAARTQQQQQPLPFPVLSPLVVPTLGVQTEVVFGDLFGLFVTVEILDIITKYNRGKTKNTGESVNQ